MVTLEEFQAKTGGRLDALDVTDAVAEVVTGSGVAEGVALVYCPHTTCCVVVSSSRTQTLEAVERLMAMVAPAHHYYEHDDLSVRTENLMEDEPPNAPAHIAHIFMGKTSESIPIIRGELALGGGQRVFLVELDSSRERRYCVQVVGE